MKKHILILAFTALALTNSCKKNNKQDLVPELKTTSLKPLKLGVADIPGSSTQQFITLSTNGNYHTNFAGGFTLSSFGWPIDLSNWQNGVAYHECGSYSITPDANNNLFYSTQIGPFMSLVFASSGSFTTQTQSAIDAYQNAWINYVNGTNVSSGFPDYSTYASQYGSTSSSALPLSAVIVIDYASPTHLSIKAGMPVPNNEPAY